MLRAPIIWVPRRTDVNHVRDLVIEKEIESRSVILKQFSNANSSSLIKLSNKIKHDHSLTSIPTVPDNFFVRIHGVNKDDRFELKDGRGIVYPQKSLEAFASFQ